MPSAEVTIAPFEKTVFTPAGSYTTPSGETEPRVDKEKVLHSFSNINDNFDKNVDQIPFSVATRGVIFRQRGTPYFVSKSDPASYIEGSTYWHNDYLEYTR